MLRLVSERHHYPARHRRRDLTSAAPDVDPHPACLPSAGAGPPRDSVARRGQRTCASEPRWQRSDEQQRQSNIPATGRTPSAIAPGRRDVTDRHQLGGSLAFHHLRRASTSDHRRVDGRPASACTSNAGARFHASAITSPSVQTSRRYTSSVDTKGAEPVQRYAKPSQSPSSDGKYASQIGHTDERRLHFLNADSPEEAFPEAVPRLARSLSAEPRVFSSAACSDDDPVVATSPADAGSESDTGSVDGHRRFGNGPAARVTLSDPTSACRMTTPAICADPAPSRAATRTAADPQVQQGHRAHEGPRSPMSLTASAWQAALDGREGLQDHVRDDAATPPLAYTTPRGRAPRRRHGAAAAAAECAAPPSRHTIPRCRCLQRRRRTVSASRSSRTAAP